MRSFLLLFVLLMAAWPAHAEEDARAPVNTLNAGLLTIMKGGDALGHDGRAARIGAVIDETFDLPRMTRTVVGAPWRDASTDERRAMVAAFRRLTVNQYAANFDGWSGEMFRIAAKVDARGPDRLVRTELVRPDGAPVELAYRLRQRGGAWRIIDVLYDRGVSQIALQRADFAAALKDGGPAEFVRRLDAAAAKVAG
ncbi:MAG: ABC transporter substrate-binding protein [Pseudomonadota bacterium]